MTKFWHKQKCTVFRHGVYRLAQLGAKNLIRRGRPNAPPPFSHLWPIASKISWTMSPVFQYIGVTWYGCKNQTALSAGMLTRPDITRPRPRPNFEAEPPKPEGPRPRPRPDHRGRGRKVPRPRPNLRGRGQRVRGRDRGLTIEAEAERCTGMGALTTVVIMWHILARWLSGRASDLRSSSRGFEARPRRCCVTTLGKLFTPYCLCHQAV